LKYKPRKTEKTEKKQKNKKKNWKKFLRKNIRDLIFEKKTRNFQEKKEENK
jgi:hypothetical protein